MHIRIISIFIIYLIQDIKKATKFSNDNILHKLYITQCITVRDDYQIRKIKIIIVTEIRQSQQNFHFICAYYLFRYFLNANNVDMNGYRGYKYLYQTLKKECVFLLSGKYLNIKFYSNFIF